MTDEACVRFLQWALPRLGMRWKGFRKVRRQVCRRIRRRIEALGLGGYEEYRALLEQESASPGQIPDPPPQGTEWARLEALCGVTISRFRRDREVFRALEEELLPALAARTGGGGPSVPHRLHAWSAGCASGEEPYTLAILWELGVRTRFPTVDLRILATDRDPAVLDRAREARYPASTLRELSAERVEQAFEELPEGGGEQYRLRERFHRKVDLRRQDVRREMPDGPFDLVLCRNLVFTYFDEPVQRAILEGILARLADRGLLVLGGHESLPSGAWPLTRLSPGLPVWKRTSRNASQIDR